MKLPIKRAVCAAAAVLSLGASMGCLGVGSHLGSLLESQSAAMRWETQDSGAYVQMSAFLDRQMTAEEVSTIRESTDTALKTASLEAGEQTRLWYDAYSMQGELLTASGTRQSSTRTRTIAVGGDFFLLHRMTFLSGSALTEEDLMQDRVVLDETLAWKLFGSSDAAGMTVLVNDIPCIVAGVVKLPETRAEREAYGEESLMYTSFSLYQALTGTEGTITCYEAVLPNPVRGFGSKIFTENFGTEAEDVEIIQNTDRFSVVRRWQILTHLHDLIRHSKNIAYPYWENAARTIGFDGAVFLLGSILLLLYPIGYLIWLLHKGYTVVRNRLQKRKEGQNPYLRESPVQQLIQKIRRLCRMRKKGE